MTHDSAISTVGLTKHFPGVAALTDLSLDVPAGSIYGFLGPNGAGKTTALKILAGLTRPTRGTRLGRRRPRRGGAGYRRKVGFLAQEPRFYDWMSGRDTLRFVASLYPEAGRAGAAADRRGPDPGRPRRCGRPSNRHLFGRDAPAAGHRPGAHRRAGRPAPRRAGQRPRPDRPARGPRPHARAARRGHRLLLDPHPRRRRARQRSRRHPRRRPARPVRADGRAPRELRPGPAPGRPRRRRRRHDRRPRPRSRGSSRSNRPTATPTFAPTSSASARARPPPSRHRSRASPPTTA